MSVCEECLHWHHVRLARLYVGPQGNIDIDSIAADRTEYTAVTKKTTYLKRALICEPFSQ